MHSSANQPYSFRDLRTAFLANELRNDFGGEYHANERRWRFTTLDARNDALAFVQTAPPIAVLQIPGLHTDLAVVRANHGVIIATRDDSGAYLHSRDLAIFRDDADAMNCRADTQAKFGALPRDLEIFRQRYRPEAFAQPVDAHLDASIPPLDADVRQWSARSEAYRQYLPPDERAGIASYEAARTQAAAMARTHLGLPIEQFTPLDVPEEGIVSGILIARTPHHIGILSSDTGEGYLLARELLAFPMRRDGTAELAAERLAAIAVDLKTMRAVQSRALDPGLNKDIDLGPLTLEAHLRAGSLQPILENEQGGNEDFNGAVVSRNDSYACVLDAGATLSLRFRKECPDATIGSTVAFGPSYSQPPPRKATRGR